MTTPAPTASARSSRRAKILPWALTLVLLAGAWLLNAAALPDSAPEQPFVTTTSVDSVATAGNLSAKVTAVRAARSITDPQGWTEDGTWLVVELDAAAVRSQYGSSLATAELTIGDRTFSATRRAQTMRDSGALVPGVMRHGALAFELPEGALKGTGTLRLANIGVVAGNAVIELPVDLDDVPVEDAITLPDTDWADR
ncbi:hypothetical protein [Microbacterium sp.]|uniref:hypothetical protein n=1 Tax=Microbacterium sp. TaxID=51671 RepID=UPI003A913DA5